MAPERRGWRRWPGIDGFVLTFLALIVLAVYLGRGALGGEVRVAIVLGVDALWLALTWLARRGRGEAP